MADFGSAKIQQIVSELRTAEAELSAGQSQGFKHDSVRQKAEAAVQELQQKVDEVTAEVQPYIDAWSGRKGNQQKAE